MKKFKLKNAPALKIVNSVTLIKETEKAMLISFVAPEVGSEIKFWLPKSKAKLEFGDLSLSEEIYQEKIIEYRMTNAKNIKLFVRTKEFEKSFGFYVQVYEYVSEQSISRSVYIPKSVIVERTENYIVLPIWLWNKKKEEIIDSCVSNSFRAGTLSLEIETEIL